MKDLKLNADGDLALENADLAIVEGAAEIGQGVALALASIRGEYILDESAGLDVFGLVLGKSSAVLRDAEIKREMLARPGVASLEAYTAAVDGVTRELTVNAELRAATGEAITVVNARIFVPEAGEPPIPIEPPSIFDPLPVLDLAGVNNWIWQAPNIALQAAPPLAAIGSPLPVKSTEGP